MKAATTSMPEVDCGTGGWLDALHDWPSAAIRSVHEHGSVVRVVVAKVLGSAPREVGACMLVERARILGTIGGGRFEWAAIAAARVMLGDSTAPAARIEKFVLGTQLAQCCGGVVELWLERYTRADLPMLADIAQATATGTTLTSTIQNGRVSRCITRGPLFSAGSAGLTRAQDRRELVERLERPPRLWLYGAGHVGQALVRVLADLPVAVTWMDSRAELLPNAPAANINVLHVADLPGTVAAAPAGTHFFVTTHSHPLDYALCRTILERGDHAWAGVIGSKSKAARFRSRLAADGLSSQRIARLDCPVGIAGIHSKAPGVIAVAVAAQLLRLFDSARDEVRDASAAVQPVECRGDCGTCESARRIS